LCFSEFDLFLVGFVFGEAGSVFSVGSDIGELCDLGFDSVVEEVIGRRGVGLGVTERGFTELVEQGVRYLDIDSTIGHDQNTVIAHVFGYHRGRDATVSSVFRFGHGGWCWC
jgi:hypothetical protein